jgi:hypothetical protein
MYEDNEPGRWRMDGAAYTSGTRAGGVIPDVGDSSVWSATGLATGTVSNLARGMIEPHSTIGAAMQSIAANGRAMRAACDWGRQSVLVGMQESAMAQQQQRLADLCKIPSPWDDALSGPSPIQAQLQRCAEEARQMQRLVDSCKPPASVLDMLKPPPIHAELQRLAEFGKTARALPSYKALFEMPTYGFDATVLGRTLAASVPGVLQRTLDAATADAQRWLAKQAERTRDAEKFTRRNLRVLGEEIARAPMAARHFLSRRMPVALGTSRRRARQWIARALAVLASWNPLFTHRDRRTVTERPGRYEYLKNLLGEIGLAPPGSLDPVAGAVSRRGPPPTYVTLPCSQSVDSKSMRWSRC